MTRLSDDTINRLKGLDIKDVADRLGVELPRGNGSVTRQYAEYCDWYSEQEKKLTKK